MPLSRDMPAPVNATTLVDAARTSATSSMLARRVVFFGPQSDEVKAPICLATGTSETHSMERTRKRTSAHPLVRAVLYRP